MEQPDAPGDPHGLEIEAVEWLPSGAESDLVRVRGRCRAPLTTLPDLLVGGQRLPSLPDPRAARDAGVWRGTYLVPSGLLPPDVWHLEFSGGPRIALGEPARGLGAPEPRRPAPVHEPEGKGGEVIDRAVLAERRARRAEAAEHAQARIATQALKAVELLELRAAELERALEAVSVERDGLLGRGRAETELRSRLAAAQARLAEAEAAAPRRAEMAAALEAAARTRHQARDLRLHLRVAEIARTSDAVRLAVLEDSLPEAAQLRSALAERERELAAARPAVAALEAEREQRVNAQLELAAARLDIENLQAELTRLESERADAAEAQAEAARARVDLRIAETAARAESIARAALTGELDAARAELERLRAGLAPAPRSKVDLAAAAAAQAEAARAAATAPAPDLAADLDAAAEALRARAAAPLAPEPAPEGERTRGVAQAQSIDHQDLPWLRGALVRMAREEPALAGQLLVGLVPAQSAVVSEPIEYDLTVRGLGTFAVSGTPEGTTVEPLTRRRPRRRIDFRLTVDPPVLAEMLAGRQRPLSRFSRGARIQGRNAHRVAELWRVTHSQFTLAFAAQSGARLDPAPVFHAFAYVIHPGWTRGHAFTVAQEILGEGTWFVTIADGGPVQVSDVPPETPPVATVSMSRATFDALLRREVPPPGERPAIRGDRRAVELLRIWSDRAQGLA